MAKIIYFIIGLLLFVPDAGFAQQGNLREKLKKVYSSQIGVREKTGKNDGVQVEQYLKYTGLVKGYPWCAAFVCWSYGQAGIPNPKTAYCPALFTSKYVIYKSHQVIKLPVSGDIFGIWFSNLKRIAHTGFVDSWSEKFVITVEGNTNDALSRDGDGVYKKKRLRSQIHSVARYIND